MAISKKKLVCVLLSGVTGMSVVGCNSIKSTEPLTLEEVAGKRLASITSDDREKIVFEQISGRIVVDKDNLIQIDEKDMSVISNLINSVNANLRGEDNKALSTEFANYLLTEFAKTPYEWEQSNIEAIGYDPATRLYFVDVEYKTNGNLKSAIATSKIPMGSPTEDVLKQKRYEDYMNYMTLRANGNPQADAKLNEFVSRWGSVESIKEEQQGVSLLERTRKKAKSQPVVEAPPVVETTPVEGEGAEGVVEGEVAPVEPVVETPVVQSSGNGIGKLTYAGLVSDNKLNVGAKMTVRYVLKYKYNLGEETDLMVNSLYVKNYELNDADNLLKSYNSENNKGVEVLKPFIDKLILSYNKAVETTNNIGLYQLFDNYGAIDKYYEDLSKYTYTNFGGYTYNILERSGTNLVVQVDRVVKTRARGTEMSLPTYQETSIFNIVLDKDDTLKIRSVYPVKSTMIGEPLSVIENVSGVSDLINYSNESFTKENQDKVEAVLKQFSKAVIKGSVDCKEFNQSVDMGVSQLTLKKMADAITSIDANKKTTYIVNWGTKSNSFVSVTLRDIFETETGNYDTESIVDLANTGGVWKIVDYTRVLNVQTEKTQMDSKDALCVDTK